MKKIYRVTLLLALAVGCFACSEPEVPEVVPPTPTLPPLQGAALVSGEAVPATATEGLAPLSLKKSVSAVLVGAEKISSKEYPDLFLTSTFGLGTAQGGHFGLNLCEYKGKTDDGRLIYGTPIHIATHPWEQSDVNVRIVTIEGDIYAFYLTAQRFRVALYDKAAKSFGESWISNEQIDLSSLGINGIGAFDVKIAGDSVEVVFLGADLSGYQPPMDDVADSYYDSMGIYRGELPYYGVYTMSFNRSNWQLKSVTKPLSANPSAILAGQGLTLVKGAAEGYVLGNKFGTLKWLPAKSGSYEDYLYNSEGEVLINNNVMSNIFTVAADADGVKDDFITSGEGMLYLYRATGEVTADGTPIYAEGVPIMQENGNIYPGSLSVPSVVDWDGDGVLDIVAGNSEGRLLFFKNRGSNSSPAFGPYEYLCSEGVPICFRAGYYEVQGPLEAGWGYLCPNVVDWNGDGLLDVVFSTNEGKFEYMLNEGTATEPYLGPRQTIMLDGLELYGVWRCRPAVASVNGKTYIAIMDDGDALHLYEKRADNAVVDRGRMLLADGKEITGYQNTTTAESLGYRGREKLEFVDWNGDGDLDLVVGTPLQSSFPFPDYGLPASRPRGLQVIMFDNVGTGGEFKFAYPKQFQFKGKDFRLGAHANSPAACMLGDTSRGPNLLVGCESGNFYFFNHYDLTTVGLSW